MTKEGIIGCEALRASDDNTFLEVRPAKQHRKISSSL